MYTSSCGKWIVQLVGNQINQFSGSFSGCNSFVTVRWLCSQDGQRWVSNCSKPTNISNTTRPDQTNVNGLVGSSWSHDRSSKLSYTMEWSLWWIMFLVLAPSPPPMTTSMMMRMLIGKTGEAPMFAFPTRRRPLRNTSSTIVALQ